MPRCCIAQDDAAHEQVGHAGSRLQCPDRGLPSQAVDGRRPRRPGERWRSVVATLVGRRRVHNPLDALSERERDVLAVMAEGRSNQAIGERLFLSQKTVEAYVRSVFTKLGMHQAVDDNRRVLAVLAFLRG